MIGLHEILTVLIQASHLKDVEYVMNIRLSQTKGQDRSSQVGMAVEVERFSAEHLVHLEACISRFDRLMLARRTYVGITSGA